MIAEKPQLLGIYKFSIKRRIPNARINHKAYVALVNKVNDAPFKGCAVGECLFLGVSTVRRHDDACEITFHFAVSPNQINMRIGNAVVPLKKGWEYLEIHYDIDDKSNVQPMIIHRKKLFEEGDFSMLGIGT